MSKKMLFRVLIMVLALFSTVLVASAQGGDLPAGTVVTETFNGTPIIYTFSGNADEIVTLYAIGSTGVQPTIALASSSGQPIAFSDGDPLTPMSNDTRISARLTSTELYIVTVSSLDNVAGSFSLIRTVSPAVVATPLTETVDASVAPDTPEQAFAVPANPDVPQQITISSPNADFTLQVITADGTVLASIAGGLESITFTIPPSSTETTIIIGAVDPAVGTSVQVSPSGSTSSSASTAPTTPSDPNQCVAVGNGVNLRSGPGTNYNALASLTSDGQVIVTGQNNGWYYGTYNGQFVWVASSVVTLAGNCDNLAFVEAPPVPDAPAPQTTEEVTGDSPTATTVSPTATTSSEATTQPTNTSPTQAPPTATTAPTEVPFEVVSLTCNYFQNEGATVFFNVTGQPNSSFLVETRFGSTTYSQTRTMNDQGFLNANQRFGQVGNSNYRAYIVYNGQDVASTDC
ncbi:MAG: SH3 domain-containing protein [Chloroflexota bacterium]